MREFTVTENDAGQRLDKFITKLMPKLPKSMLYKGLRKNCVRVNGKHKKDGAVFVASGVVPVVNTLLFIVGCLGMTDSVYAAAGDENVLKFILVGLVTFNFFIEFAINLIVAPALHQVIGIVDKRYKRKKV
jgi:hypothetical protein